MLLRKILSPKLNPPSDLSESEFLRQKIMLTCYAVGWIAFLVFLYIKWFDLPLPLRILLGFIEFVLTPDIGIIKDIFRSFGGNKNQSPNA